jgi:hypothetical protein
VGSKRQGDVGEQGALGQEDEAKPIQGQMFQL